MNTGEIDPILINCLDGTATEADMALAWEWIQQSDENKKYYEHIREVWLSATVFAPSAGDQYERSWLSFRNRNLVRQDIGEGTHNLKSRGNLLRGPRVAAALILALLIGGIASRVIFDSKTDQDRDSYVIEAPRGAKSFVTLSDGTTIWLNAGSKISYHRNYNQENRNIFLEGEAYFIVTRNKSIPFQVYSSGLAIKALGTAFNVKAYPEEDIIETTLVEGKISIESTGKSGRKEKVLIEPNQKASFYKSSERMLVSPQITENLPEPQRKETKIARIEVSKKINTELYTSWKDKRWVFKKQKLGDFAVILERLYDVKIIFKDEELKHYSLSGSFEEENLEQVLKAIQLTVPLDYSVQHREVVFKIDNEKRNSDKNLLKPASTDKNP